MSNFFPELKISEVHGKLIHKKFAHIDTEYFLPLYHPASALVPSSSGMPEVLGINLIFADSVVPVVTGGCGKEEKRIDYWRSGFLSLSDILCWPTRVVRKSTPTGSPPADENEMMLVGGFHPDDVARRLRNLRDHKTRSAKPQTLERRPIVSSDRIPPNIMRGILGETTPEDRRELKRPRIIFSTDLQRK